MASMNSAEIKLYGEQQTVFADWLNTDLHCIDILPAGSGKTFLASIFLPIAASDARYHKGKDILYVAPTREMIKTLIWEQLKLSCQQYFGIKDDAINNGELTIKFANGVFIRCKSAEQRENLRGINAGIAIMDEASLYPAESLLEITNRLRPKVGEPDTAGRMIVISTPYGAGPLYDLFQNAQANPQRYRVRHYNYEQMRSGNKEFILEQKRILSPMKFAQDYLCSFESVTDQFFYAFAPQYHVSTVQDLGGDLYSFHDFNKRVCCAVIAQVEKPYDPSGSIRILKSYAIDNCGTEQMAQTIRQDFPRRRIYSIIDMSGSHVNRDTTSAFGITDRNILERYGFQIINSNKANPLIGDTDNICNAFIHQNRLTVDSKETRLIDALKSYHFEDGSRKKLVKYTDKYAYIDGLGDCMRYGITLLFPPQYETIPGGEYVGMDPKYAKITDPANKYAPESPLYPGGPSWEEILNGEQEQDYQIWK